MSRGPLDEKRRLNHRAQPHLFVGLREVVVPLLLDVRNVLPLLLDLDLHGFVGVPEQDDLVGRVRSLAVVLLGHRGGPLEVKVQEASIIKH